jgi:hypothetical protein
MGVLAAIVLWLLSYVGASSGCFGDNVACVHRGVYDTYRGRVFDYRGRPASRVRLLVSSLVAVDRSHESATTDRQGRFCVYVLAPSYGIISIAIAGQRNVRDLVVRSEEPIDPRLADPAKRAALHRLPNYSGPNFLPFVLTPPTRVGFAYNASYYAEGAVPVPDLWRARTDSSDECTTVATHGPWWRIQDARESWQFAALTVAPLGVIGMFLFAASENRASRRRGGSGVVSLYRLCAVAGALNIVLFLSLWGVWV